MIKNRHHLSKEEKQISSRLAQLVHKGEILRGNIVKMARECGKMNCRCRRGKKHISSYIAQSYQGKTQMLYIPKLWEEKVKVWVEKYQQVRTLLEYLSQISWDKLKNRKE